jgi:hypothetical protein
VGNLSRSKWCLADFRNKANAIGWTEADRVPGWGTTRGRFSAFLEEVGHGDRAVSFMYENVENAKLAVKESSVFVLF